MPWTDVWQPGDLDILYYMGNSGDKNPSAMVDKLMAANDVTTLDLLTMDTLARAIKTRYLIKWEHQWATTTQEYNIIHNYDSSESRSWTDTHSGTDQTRSIQGTASRGDVYAFNSDRSAPVTHSNGASEASASVTHGEAIEHTESFERSGNIGVTTSQQMLEAERALWEWEIISVIFEDIDRVLCTSVYD